MSTCPHCNQAGISGHAKWRARETAPAKCSQCQKLSYVPFSAVALIRIAVIVMLIPLACIAIIVKSWLLAGIGLLGLLLAYAWLWQRAELIPARSNAVVVNQIMREMGDRNAARAETKVNITVGILTGLLALFIS